MEVSDLSFDEEEMTELINHVFLPRKVPGTEAEPLIKIKGEENILTLLTNVLNYSEYGNIVPSATKELFASWSVNQFEQNPANLSKTLRNIKKGLIHNLLVISLKLFLTNIHFRILWVLHPSPKRWNIGTRRLL